MRRNQDDSLPDLAEITDTAADLRGSVHRTPVITSRQLAELAGLRTYLKVEAFQRGGSHKIRGALATLGALSKSPSPPAGVVTASSGNHGQAVAAAARHYGMGAVVVMPDGSNALKIAAATAAGADVRTAGVTVLTREADADAEARERNWARVRADDHPGVAGLGSLGLEILDQVPDVGTIVVPLGLGALLSGVATAVKAVRPQVTVVGVEPLGAADAARSFRERRIVRLTEPPDTIADGARALALSPRTFRGLIEYVDEVVTVTDDAILEASYLLMTRTKVVVEPTGALAYAALIAERRQWPEPVVCVLSGGNADLIDLAGRFAAAGYGGGSR